jgi:hypothetical protein
VIVTGRPVSASTCAATSGVGVDVADREVPAADGKGIRITRQAMMLLSRVLFRAAARRLQSFLARV